MGNKGYLDGRNYIADRNIIRSAVGNPDLAVVSQPGSVFRIWDGNAAQCSCRYHSSVVHPPTFSCKWYCDGRIGDWRSYLFISYKCYDSEMGYRLGFPDPGYRLCCCVRRLYYHCEKSEQGHWSHSNRFSYRAIEKTRIFAYFGLGLF